MDLLTTMTLARPIYPPIDSSRAPRIPPGCASNWRWTPLIFSYNYPPHLDNTYIQYIYILCIHSVKYIIQENKDALFQV